MNNQKSQQDGLHVNVTPDDSRVPGEGIHSEQLHPSQPQQEDGYTRGVDLIRLISTEFGISEVVVNQQLRANENAVEVTIGGKPYAPKDRALRFRPPYSLIKDKEVVVVGDRLHFRFSFRG